MPIQETTQDQQPKKRGRKKKEVVADPNATSEVIKPKRAYRKKTAVGLVGVGSSVVHETTTVIPPETDALIQELQHKMAELGPITEEAKRFQLRTIVRARASIMKDRVGAGNKLIAIIKRNRGIISAPGCTNEEPDAEGAKILAGMVDQYTRLSDAVALGVISSKKVKELFTPDEYAYAAEYVARLSCEKLFEEMLNPLVSKHPLWESFFSKIPGVGPWAAGVMLSEFNIDKAATSAAMHKYAGLDVVKTYYTLGPKGKKNYMPQHEADMHPDKENLPFDMLGRTNKHYHLVQVSYDTGKKDEDGNPIFKLKMGITYNSFLRGVLVGVMFKNMMMAKKILVDGVAMGSAKRVRMAMDEGYNSGVHGALAKDVNNFLMSRGHSVEVVTSKYMKAYEDHITRLRITSKDTLTALHMQNQARRIPVKMLIEDLYAAWCEHVGREPVQPYRDFIRNREHHMSVEDKRLALAANTNWVDDEARAEDLANDPFIAEDNAQTDMFGDDV